MRTGDILLPKRCEIVVLISLLACYSPHHAIINKAFNFSINPKFWPSSFTKLPPFVPKGHEIGLDPMAGLDGGGAE